VRKRHGNLNNITICNGKVQQVLANVNGVLAVACRSNNGGHVRPPVGILSFNTSFEITNYTLGGDSTDPNGGISNLVEIYEGRDPSVSVTPKVKRSIVGVTGVSSKTLIDYYDQTEIMAIK